MDSIMKLQVQIYSFFGIFCFGSMVAALPAWAEFPRRDLTVELRQVEEGEVGGYSVGTQSRTSPWPTQQVQVQNGEKASLSIGTSLPMLWAQSVGGQRSAVTTSDASASSGGGAVNNVVTWMEAGQNLKVHPRWPGKQQPVMVDVEFQTASVGSRLGTELPAQARSHVSTTVSAPIGQWVTIASTGRSPQRGVFGSDANSRSQILLQIRVLAP